ncbi:MAG: HNH endonuclease [Thermomicrobiales bacterium]
MLDLPGGHQTVIDQADYPLVEDLTMYLGVNGYVYFSRWVNGKSQTQTLHRFLMSAPKGMHVDHVNGDKTDNRRSVNLRAVTPQTNQVNRLRLNKNNTSGIRGVAHRPHMSVRNPWRAQIMVNHRCLHLGMFPTQDAAVAARKDAERRFFEEVCP